MMWRTQLPAKYHAKINEKNKKAKTQKTQVWPQKSSAFWPFLGQNLKDPNVLKTFQAVIGEKLF